MEQYRSGLRSRAPVLLCLGDSNTAGQGSAGDIGSANKTLSYPSQLAGILTSLGLAARESSWLGTNASVTTGQNTASYDPRWGGAWGAGWAPSLASIGGYALTNSTTTNTVSFTPGQTWDRMEIYFAQNSGNGTFSWNLDGGAATNVNTAGSSKVGRVDVSVPWGTHTLNLTRVGSGTVYLYGVICYDSTVKEASIVNAGIGGGNSANLGDTSQWRTIYSLPTLAPDAAVIQTIINDANGGVTLANYEKDLTTCIEACLRTGDVMLTTSWPWNASSYSSSSEPYRNILRGLASKYACPMIEVERNGWPIFDASAALNFDNLHPNSSGYALLAQIVANAVLRAF